MHDVYIADYAIVTQFDDGATQWTERYWRPSCSAAQPSVVVGMLNALNSKTLIRNSQLFYCWIFLEAVRLPSRLSADQSKHQCGRQMAARFSHLP
jgi:hypothetical protein